MKYKNHTIRLVTGFFLLFIIGGLFAYSTLLAQNSQQNEESINTCVEWVNDFEKKLFFADVRVPTFPGKSIHFWNLLANSYEKSTQDIPLKFFPQRTVSERDFILMLKDFNELTKKQNAPWFSSRLSKKTNKKLTQSNAIRLTGDIFNLPQKIIQAQFRQTRAPRGKWILRHEAAQVLYRLALKTLPESPEQSLCKKWANDDTETFNEEFGQEEVNPPANPVGTSTSSGTTSDASTSTTNTSTPSNITPASPTTAPASPILPATTGTSTQAVTTSTGTSTTTQSPLPVISDAPPTILSITPYDPIPLNKNFISSITLKWSAVDNPNTGYRTYYKLWRRLDGGDWLLWAETQQTTFPDLNIGRGTYDYYLKACVPSTTTSPGGLAIYHCGRDSNIMTATLAGGGDTSDTIPPSTPTGLKAWPDPYNRNFISWTASTDNIGVAGYNIYRNGIYLKSISGSPAEDGFLFSSTTPFNYTVAAYDAAGNISAQSASVGVTTQ